MKYPVSVTHDDILLGQTGSEEWCPIARAVRRVLPGRRIRVIDKFVRVDDGHAWLPGEAQEFVELFDAGCEVHPFDFELDDGDDS